jgi:hypothetical protein
MSEFPTAGDGLVRPLNAPQGQQILPGVQPGVSGAVVLAQYVIIFGASGGLFIYSGSPGPGNPPIYTISNATQDPYGNAIEAGIWAGPFGGSQAGLQYSGTSAQLAFPVAGRSPAAVGGISGVVAGGGSEVQVFSAVDAAPNNDRVFIVLADNAASGGTSAAYFIVYQDANGGQFVQVEGGDAGLALNSVSQLTAVLPGTGTSNVNAAQPETWHPITLDAGWSTVAGYQAPQYRLWPNGDVEFAGTLSHAAFNVSTPINSANPLPVAYRSSSRLAYRTGNGGTIADIEYQTTGVLNAIGQAAGSVRAAISGTCSL